MENPASFDLNQNMRQWRDSLAQSAALRTEDLDELEQHLRDSMAQLRARQLSEEESFLVAARRLGGGEVLTREFAKANPSRVWQSRLCWMIAGIFLFQLILHFPGSLITTTGWAALLPINGHLVGLLSVALKWATLISAAALLLWVSRTQPEYCRLWTTRWLNHPVRSTICMVFVSVILPAFFFFILPNLILHRGTGIVLPPEASARFNTAHLWDLYGFHWGQYLLLPIALVYLARRALKPRLAE
jgi:hypothetical protein